jgi:hypothetical protein
LNIARTFEAMLIATSIISKCHFSPTTRYFVEMPHNLVALTINCENDKLVMNLEDPNLKIK